MVNEIRIYIEGGGDGKNTKALIRKGFSTFFKDIIEVVRSKRIKWEIIICGSRNNAFNDFKKALEDYPNAFIILLVDAEAPVNQSPWQHLKSFDNWNAPEVDDTHCHLMVQAMESWFMADIEALKKFYGNGFKENAIPKTINVEKIDKNLLEPSLKAASKDTLKGEYHKIQHAYQLLEMIDVAKVRERSGYCDRLFTTLSQIIEPTS